MNKLLYTEHGEIINMLSRSARFCFRSFSALPASRMLGSSIRCFSQSTGPIPNSGDEQKEMKKNPAWVDLINGSLARYPLTTIGSFAVMDATSIIGIATCLSYADIVVPSDFALAYGISRVLRKVRLPVDFAVAALLAKAFPTLTLVKPIEAMRKGSMSESNNIQNAMKNPRTFLGKAVIRFQEMLDKYGLAFLITQRSITGVASVGVIYTALVHGVDVQSYLADWDFAKVGEKAGQWSLAACISGPFFPGVLVGSAWLGRALGRMRGR